MVEPVGPTGPAAQPIEITGRVWSADRVGLGELFVEIVQRAVGNDVRLAGASTDDQGQYRASLDGLGQPDLQARAWTSDEDTAVFLGESTVRYDAGPAETLDIEVTTGLAGLPSEYQVLTAALRSGQPGPLADLEESGERQDISYLAHKTGWDARAVAMAALADQLSAGAGGRIDPPLYYALLRAGLPADPARLHQARPELVDRIWQSAVQQGVIAAALGPALPQAQQAFAELAADHALPYRAVAGTSSLAELLERTFPADPASQSRFAQLYVQTGSDPGRFWPAVAEAFGQAAADQLRLDGQLAVLTGNNAPLIAALHAAEEQHPDGRGSIAEPLDLARRGYHRPERWQAALADQLPTRVRGATEQQRRTDYAELLAARVRLSFPTAVLAAQIDAGELLSTVEPDVRDGVHRFLMDNHGQFELAAEPIEGYLARGSVPADPRITHQIKRIQRVYQVSPTDRAMQVLLDNGFDSAHAIASHDQDRFVAARSDDLGPADARAVHARASQIVNSVQNIAASYLMARSAPKLGMQADAPILLASAELSGVLAYPTLDGLFGALNFDACQDCDSVLSPAAYLVELLQFIDQGGLPVSPQQVLLDRRPDIAQLPLTCENTDTALPYIDLVNETLEYFVVHELSLAGYLGHDTDAGLDPAGLLADPQYVDQAAYQRLANQYYPLPLPFHRWLETLRGLFGQLGVPLEQAMAVLRADEALDRPAPGYGWRDILIEALGLSRAEYRVLTDRSLNLQQLLGYPAATTTAAVLTELTGVAGFADRLGVPYTDLVRLLLTRTVNPDASIMLTGADADASSFENLQLKHVRPDGGQSALTALDLVRTIRFVRLWRKLGWSIEQTDAAVAALYPADQLPSGADEAAELARLDAGWAGLLVRLGSAVSILRRLKLGVDNGLAGLLACWAPIDAHGPGSLYRQLFLAGSQRDPAFAADGLAGASGPLLVHQDALRAAFGLTATDFGLIGSALGIGAGTPLSLDTVSAIYRQAWLARVLGLDQPTLLALTGLTRLNPFALPEPGKPGLADLLDLLDDLSSVGWNPASALELLWNADGSTDDRQLYQLARALRTALATVDTELAVDDGVTADRAQALLSLAYGSGPAELFAGLLTGSLAVEVAYQQPQPILDPAVLTAGAGRLGYDPFRQRLSYSGVLTEPVRDALKSTAAPAGFAAAVDALFAASEAKRAQDAVFASSGSAIDALFGQYPTLRTLLAAYAGSADPMAVRLQALLAQVLPPIRADRRRQAALTVLTATDRIDPAIAQAVLLDTRVLQASSDPQAPAIDDAVALAGGGLDLPAAGHGYRGYLEVPATGQYRLGVQPASGTVRLVLAGVEVGLQAEQGSLRSVPINLEAGRLIPISLTVQEDSATLSWQQGDRPWQDVRADRLYGTGPIDGLRASYLRFGKAVALARTLRLSATELSYLAGSAELRVAGQPWLNALGVDGPAPASTELTATLRRLLDYAVLVGRFGNGPALVTALRNPTDDAALSAATGWQLIDLDGLLARLGNSRADLARLAVARRVSDGLLLLARFGISAASLLPVLGNDPDAAAVQTLQATLRAHRDQASWPDTVRAVVDPVRGLSRDALVAYILSQFRNDPGRAHLDTPDKLFEYFLMDVQMQPCMQTSRVRHAIASVQLFVDRVLLNLEQPALAPSAINSQQWEWMKRYRLWEANRQVFLWPENWLEPELRDNQSPFFRQAMSELLQSDITDDAAVQALLNYLARLEKVAKLEPCSIHYIDSNTPGSDGVAHVVARTPGAERRYYHRRCDHGSWTPWEEIGLDIEDNPITPVVWNGRLLLFWLKLIQVPAKQPPPTVPGNTPLAEVTLGQVRTDGMQSGKTLPQAALCWSEYYNGGWQPPKTSKITEPTTFNGSFDPTGEAAFNRERLRFGESTEADALRLRITGQGNGSSFLLFNTHGLPQRQEDRRASPLDIEAFAQFIRDIVLSDDQLTVTYRDSDTATTHTVLQRKEQGPGQITAPFPVAYFVGELQQSLIRDPWRAPFFFADSRHAFYVTSDVPVQTPVEDASFGIGSVPPQAGEFPALTVRPVGAVRTVFDTDAELPFGDGMITAHGRSSTEAQPLIRNRSRRTDG